LLRDREAKAPPIAATQPINKPTDEPIDRPPIRAVHATMQAQIDHLAKDDFQAFAHSFSVPVTREQFDICKKRMAHAHLSPDWEMAEVGEENGRRVVRVSIFGKGMTAFRERDGGYVADTVWCVPIF
jgi:hypothetical protein